MPRVFVVDNYDSFTFNVVQALRALGADVEVAKHDALTVDELAARAPDGVVISPGPCAPESAGISLAVVKELRCPIWEFVSATKPSPRRSGRGWCAWRRSTARRRS